MTRKICLKPKHDPCDYYPCCDCGAMDKLTEESEKLGLYELPKEKEEK